MDYEFNYDPMTGEPLRAPQGEEPDAPDYTQGTYGGQGTYSAQGTYAAQDTCAAPGSTTDPSAGGKSLKRTSTYTAKEKVLAWCAAIVGYLFCRTFWVWKKPVTGLIFTLCLFVFALVFFGKQKRKARSWFYPVSALLLSSALFLSGSPVLLVLVFTYSCAAFLMFCQTGSATALESYAGRLYFFETLKAVFVSPFKSFGAAAGAIGTNRSGRKVGKTVLIILAGIGITVIPTAFVMWLLSFDSNFTDILARIRLTLFDNIFAHVWSLILGFPLGMYVFGALYSSAHPRPDAFNGENCVKIEDKVKFAPALAGAVAIIPLLFVYVVFIVAQQGYYRAVFTSTLPDAFTFAEFARDGFFRLCIVAAINALVLIMLRVFTRKTGSGKISPVVRVFTVILSLVTIIITGTAISQMVMYVSVYGLTRLRLYTLWFMVLLVLLFLAAILKQIIARMPFAATVLTVFVLAFGVLAVPDTDAFIARHNYNCHLAGTTYEMDTDYLGRLLPSSVPVLCEIAENDGIGEDVRKGALLQLGKYAAKAAHPDNLPSILANRAYKSLDRGMQLKAAVLYDPLQPGVNVSEERQTFMISGDFYEVTVCLYDKNEETVFTDNECYLPLKSGEQTDETAAFINDYIKACERAGKESIIPFSSGDLYSEGRFYIGVSGEGYAIKGGNYYPYLSLYLYDRNNGCLAVISR